MASTTINMTPPGPPRTRNSSLDERLPLYEELQYTDHDDNSLPSATATPAEVAYYPFHLLVSTKSMSLDQTRRAAAKWTKPTGRELLSCPPVMYFKIFGTEDGWIAYREVKMAVHREEHKKFGYRYRIYETYRSQALRRIWLMSGVTDIGLAAMACWETIALAVFLNAADKTVKLFAIVAAELEGFVLVVMFGGVCVEPYCEPRKTIERELRSELRSALLKAIPPAATVQGTIIELSTDRRSSFQVYCFEVGIPILLFLVLAGANVDGPHDINAL